ncbi:N-acetylmuramoyl-L-alanine amidase [Yoonia sp. 208BN28-4]|uniref:N-acetylmuramoyl-L-alanine amidase n=1 Tax=Yoonia sp. 208BN28-4 TaxID=3126505 RepID=UPI0030A38D8C
MLKRAFALAALMALPAVAQDFSGLARVDMGQSQIVDAGRSLQIDLHLSQTVPYRVFTLDEPPRLVADFREVDWTGVNRAGLDNADLAEDVRFGVLRPGWSRLVIAMAGPLGIAQAGMTVEPDSGAAHLAIMLNPVTEDAFAANAGAPQTQGWGPLVPETPDLPAPVPDADGTLTIVIDPGHGGIDPGAVTHTVHEADLMLALGIEVADALNRAEGFRAILTRDADVFVPLEARMSIARAAAADLFISLHADALEEDEAEGASVYTLNAEGSDRASQRMAERHERGDLLAGLDLTGQDDTIAGVLMDLARAETAPRGQRFADTLVAGLEGAGAKLNSRPRREGRLAVLNAADFPSVLVEVGFLSNADDRALLQTAQGRARIATGIVSAIQTWALDEAVRAPFVRQ